VAILVQTVLRVIFSTSGHCTAVIPVLLRTYRIVLIRRDNGRWDHPPRHGLGRGIFRRQCGVKLAMVDSIYQTGLGKRLSAADRDPACTDLHVRQQRCREDAASSGWLKLARAEVCRIAASCPFPAMIMTSTIGLFSRPDHFGVNWRGN